jgi:hypothetical protein
VSVRPLYLVVAACAVVVHFGALWNGLALDDVFIITQNPLMQSGDAVWRAFAMPYWPPELGATLYRPLPVATYALDLLTGSQAWLHLVNLLWHAAASAAVCALAGHAAGARAGLVAGLLFAVHPVHVEAVANVVGRAELMAATFTLLGVWAAVARGSVGWSTAAIALGLLSKENAAVAPVLIAWAWLVGLQRPSRRTILAFVIAWALLGGAYAAVRWAALHPYPQMQDVAPAFVGENAVTIRLTAVSALVDAARLLLFPLKLRVDYAPAERTAVHSATDARFLLGLAVLALWAYLVFQAWRRGRKVEAFGLGWIGIAYLPVANFVVPVGVLIAERTLYLPSAGLALAVGAWGVRLAERYQLVPGFPRVPLPWVAVLVAVVLAAAVRSAVRVPIWKDDVTVTRSILRDSPRSYRGHARAGTTLQAMRLPGEAMTAFANAVSIYPYDSNVLVASADAAFTLGRPQLAESLMVMVERVCFRCAGLYTGQATAARARGDSATADSLLARIRRWEAP